MEWLPGQVLPLFGGAWRARGQQGSNLGQPGGDGHVVLQELGRAVLLPHLPKLALRAALGMHLGLAVAAEQAEEDVERPLLGLPPRPRFAVQQVLWLPLL